MELKEFITETISAIAEATTELQSKFIGDETGVLINPPLSKKNDNLYMVDDLDSRYRYVSDIEFDVALTVSQDETKGGGGGLKVFAASLEGNAEKATGSQQVSRVQFSIPISLSPTQQEHDNREAYYAIYGKKRANAGQDKGSPA